MNNIDYNARYVVNGTSIQEIFQEDEIESENNVPIAGLSIDFRKI